MDELGADLERLCEIEPSTIAAAVLFHFRLLQGRFLEALQMWDRVGSPPALNSPIVAHAETLAAAVRGDLEATARAADRLSSGALQDSTIQERIAELWTHSNRPALAVEYYRRALEAGPPERIRIVRLARAQLEAGDVASALATIATTRRRPVTDPGLAEHAALLIDLHAFDDAEALLRGADAASDAAARSLLARLLLWKGLWDEADTHAAAAIALDPANAGAYRTRGAVAAMRGSDAAIGWLDRAFAMNPYDSEALIWKAEAYRRVGDHARALDCLEQANRIGDSFTVHVLEARLQAQTLRGFITLRRRAQYYRYGGLFLGRLDPFADRAIVERALRRRRTTIALLDSVLTRLGGNRTGNPQSCLLPPDGHAQSPRLVPAGIPPSSRGASWRALESIVRVPVDDVRAALDAVVRAYPRSPHPYCYRGELALWRGQWDEAIADFHRALQVEDTRWIHIGLLAGYLFRGDLDLAERAARRGNRRFPWDPASTGFVYRGELRFRQRRFDEAVRDLHIALEAKSGRVGGWVTLSLAEFARGQAAAGRRAAAEVERLAPDLIWAAARCVGHGLEGHWLDDPVRILEEAHRMLRGNRSSQVLTYVVGNVFRCSAQGWRAYLALTTGWVRSELARELTTRAGQRNQ